MRRPKDSLPPPPELPSFTVEPDPGTTEDVFLRHQQTGLVRHDAELPERDIDPDAAKVVRRLEKAGFQAYLVGGCVRDLLLGGRPKDFDIATSARPEDVRQLFRNCRVIGRRFRLAHVMFGPNKVIEVATFRKAPQETNADEEELDDLLIRSDNVFGEAHEDALRRDFTVNALFYDLDRRQVLDWCGGMDDIRGRVLRTIGDPTVRFREDPVRILRAIKFAARADLGIDPSVYDSMVLNREELARAARPRLFEEVLRLLRGGAAHRSIWLFWEMGAMHVMLPELSTFLDDDHTTVDGARRLFRALDGIDARTKRYGAIDDLVLVTTLLFEPIWEAASGVKDPVGALHELLEPIVQRIAMPRRVADGVRRIVMMVPRIMKGEGGRAARSELYPQALDVAELVLEARERSTDAVRALREAYRESAPVVEADEGRAARTGRRRSGRSRRRG